MIDLRLRAFSSLSRLKLMICLGKGKKSVSDLVKVCDLSQSAVSQHLIKLRKWGFVRRLKEGRVSYYELKEKKAAAISKMIFEFFKKI